MWTKDKITYGARKAQICPDGFKISVQGGYGLYSRPNVYLDDLADYDTVECMLDQSMVPDSWEEYDADGVYAQVPIKLVKQLLITHGVHEFINSKDSFNWQTNEKVSERSIGKEFYFINDTELSKPLYDKITQEAQANPETPLEWILALYKTEIDEEGKN